MVSQIQVASIWMKSAADAGSGWIEKDLSRKPKALFFTTMSILWTFPALGAIWILLSNPAWKEAPDAMALVKSIALEQWLALLLLAIHPTLVYLAIRSYRKERRAAVGPGPNPGPDS
jgi:hypothetical protein